MTFRTHRETHEAIQVLLKWLTQTFVEKYNSTLLNIKNIIKLMSTQLGFTNK